MSKFLASKSDKHLHKWGFKDSGFKSIGDKVVKFSLKVLGRHIWKMM